jgi:hypothetical protein
MDGHHHFSSFFHPMMGSGSSFSNCTFAQECWSLLHLVIPAGDPFD